MTLQEYNYDSAGFFGREDIVKSIIETLADQISEPANPRAVLVEGPKSRGKTWLLHRIHEQIQQDHADRIAVSFFAGDHIHIQSGQRHESFEELLLQLLAALWDVLHHYCPLLPWPIDGDSHDYPQRLEKISQLLRRSQTQTLLRLITEKIDEVDLPILLIIIDGMDEIDIDILKLFEFQFIHELFRNPRVRLLASRRINNTTHQWRKPLIKQQNKTITLEPFKSAEQQANYIIQSRGSKITFQELQKKMRFYSWLNPGANTFLINCALDEIKDPPNMCVRECLEFLLRSAHGNSLIGDQEFEYIHRMAITFPEINQQGVARHKLNDVFDNTSDHQRDEFLGRLQGRGIGYFGNSGNYVLHSDFVQLFREL